MKESIRRLMEEPEMRQRRNRQNGRYMGMEDYSGRNGRQIGYGENRYDRGERYDTYNAFNDTFNDGYTGGNNRNEMTYGSTHASEQMETGLASVQDYLEEPLTVSEAKKWVDSLEDGGKFKHEETKQIAQQMGIPTSGDKYAEFYAVINALYSDFGKVLKGYGMDGIDIYAKLAKAWIHDKDAVENKSAVYYRFIVED